MAYYPYMDTSTLNTDPDMGGATNLPGFVRRLDVSSLGEGRKTDAMSGVVLKVLGRGLGSDRLCVTEQHRTNNNTVTDTKDV